MLKISIISVNSSAYKYYIYFLKEIVHAIPVKEVMNLSEEEKIQVATDLAEAIYFLHGHSPVSQKMLLMFNEILFGLK